jgi:diacylglycerol kinase (ATP)
VSDAQATSEPRRPILLLANPAAGGKPASGKPLSDDPNRLEPRALAASLRAQGLEVELHMLTASDDVAGLSRSAAGSHDVVVAGGDGTAGPAGLALVGSQATLGILALGSFNNIARGLGLPDELDAAVAVIGRGHTLSVDVAVAERRGSDPEPFLEAAGIGLDAMGFDALLLADRHGMLRGLRFLWRALQRSPARIELELDGRRTGTDGPTVVVCNGPYHGAGFAIAPDADPTDGHLDVAVFERMGRLQTIRHYLRVARGRRVRERRVRVVRATRVSVRTRRGTLPVQVDGRSIGATPIDFGVRPAALRVFR